MVLLSEDNNSKKAKNTNIEVEIPVLNNPNVKAEAIEVQFCQEP